MPILGLDSSLLGLPAHYILNYRILGMKIRDSIKFGWQLFYVDELLVPAAGLSTQENRCYLINELFAASTVPEASVVEAQVYF